MILLIFMARSRGLPVGVLRIREVVSSFGLCQIRPAAAGLTNFGASDGTCGEWTVQQPDHVEETCRKINHPSYNLYNLQL